MRRGGDGPVSGSFWGQALVSVGLCGALAGCAPGGQDRLPVTLPDTRTALDLTAQEGREHRAVMLQHLETVQAIVAALAEEDFVRAQGLTEAHLGFFMHRQAMARQHPESFPPAYHDLAMAHHEAAEALAGTIPSRDLKQILPKLDGVLKACVACHLSFKVHEQG
ncbi:MAG: hypothetical protein KGL03_00715 [Nitrospirota bacterium]|nr:hypothetical protein [Nitrospirota bacterium]